MRFAQSSFNRNNVSFCPDVSPFDHTQDQVKKYSEEPRQKISPKRKPLGSLSKKIRSNCPNHPSQRSSSWVTKDSDCGFCSKCSLASNNYDNVLKQKKMSKSRSIQEFKVEINELRDRIQSNQYQMDENAILLEKSYIHEIQKAQSQFQEVFELLNLKYGKCLERIKYKYNLTKNNRRAYCIDIEETLQTLDKFQEDIDKNYSSIVNQLNLQSFSTIMGEYKIKLSKASFKIQSVPSLKLDVSDETVTLRNMATMLVSRDFNMPRASIGNQNAKENDMNFANIEISPSRTAKLNK